MYITSYLSHLCSILELGRLGDTVTTFKKFLICPRCKHNVTGERTEVFKRRQ